jgi:undecaprenyl diphosphate synthase
VNDDLLKSRLSTKVLPPVDLLIRTGGEKRISNFMLWDLSYAELVFSDIYWPEYTITDFLSAIDEFYKRDRRYGGSKGEVHHIFVVQSDLA